MPRERLRRAQAKNRQETAFAGRALKAAPTNRNSFFGDVTGKRKKARHRIGRQRACLIIKVKRPRRGILCLFFKGVAIIEMRRREQGNNFYNRNGAQSAWAGVNFIMRLSVNARSTKWKMVAMLWRFDARSC